jgi:WXG100 family type VII secretion target
MMTPQELNDGASFLRQRLDAINQEIASLKSKIDDVSSRWEGAAQQSFINQFESDMYPILRDTLPQVIDGVASELDAAANAIRETDASLASAFKG